MTLLSLDFSSYTVDAAPPVTLGVELWDGQYDTRYPNASTGDWYSGATYRTTKAIAVSEGKIYCFSGGNRCRLMWYDASDTFLYGSDEGNTGDARYAIAPESAAKVYYYYYSDGTNAASVKEVTGGLCPVFVLPSATYLTKQPSTDKVVRATLSTSARHALVFAGTDAVSDYEVTAKVKCSAFYPSDGMVSQANMAVMGRASKSAASETFYAVLLRTGGAAGTGQFEICKYVNGTFTTITYASYAFTNGTEYWAKLALEGTGITAKIWTGAIGDEPSSWTLLATDSSITTGAPGVFFFNNPGSGEYYELGAIQSATDVSYVTNAIVTQQYLEVAVQPQAPPNAAVTQQYIEVGYVDGGSTPEEPTPGNVKLYLGTTPIGAIYLGTQNITDVILGG